jgi:hypothetical protein
MTIHLLTTASAPQIRVYQDRARITILKIMAAVPPRSHIKSPAFKHTSLQPDIKSLRERQIRMTPSQMRMRYTVKAIKYNLLSRMAVLNKSHQ